MADALKNLEKETEKRAEKLRLALSAYRLQTVALLEAIHASAGIYQLLTAGKERVALGANFNLELTLDGTALEGLTASATNDALTVIGVDILLHRVILLYLLGAGRLAALLLHAGIYNPNEVIISYTAVPVQVLF